MIINIKIPSPGESITEVELASWFIENGDTVSKDQEIGEVESEKATLPLIAEKAGKVELLASVGDTLAVGTVVCRIDTSVKVEEKKKVAQKKEDAKEDRTVQQAGEIVAEKTSVPDTGDLSEVKITPVARKIMKKNNLNVEDIIHGLKKINSDDVNAIVNNSQIPDSVTKEITRNIQKKAISQLRKKISERLVAVKNETAMLTTFNEADMSSIMMLRKKYQDSFTKKHGVKLGFMSFFTKAVTLALQHFPSVNSYIDGDNIISPDYYDIGIAVQTEKGLLVPVLRNTETLGLADIEKQILDIAGRARKNRISMDELSGGTFTITNGGVFGSMLSTPILNPPQSGILGMHNIIERPVAINGKVEIRPMMYVALSYDHRVIDGKDSVGFLKTVKEYIEDPTKMLFENTEPDSLLLNL